MVEKWIQRIENLNEVRKEAGELEINMRLNGRDITELRMMLGALQELLEVQEKAVLETLSSGGNNG